MVVENEDGIVGYALSVLNITNHNKKLSISWIPEMCSKYPLNESVNELPQNIQVFYYIFSVFFFINLYICIFYFHFIYVSVFFVFILFHSKFEHFTFDFTVLFFKKILFY